MIGSVNYITRIEFVLLELLFRFFLSKEKIVNRTLQKNRKGTNCDNFFIDYTKGKIILSFCIVLAGNLDINYRACSSVNGKTVSIIMKCLFEIVWFFFFGSLRFYSLPFDFNISFLILFALEYFVSRNRDIGWMILFYWNNAQCEWKKWL